MSIKYNDKTNNQEILLAGISSVDQILNSNSKNAISNKAVYNALQEKIEKSVNDLIYYYDKNDVYNKAEVRQLIGAINTLTIEVVAQLPTSDISTTTIYFVGPAAGTNTYDEYVYVNNTWVKIGDTDIDLSDYVTSANLTTILQSYYTKAEVDNLLNSYYTKSQVDIELDTKQDTLTFDNVPTAGSNNPVKSSGIKSAIDAKQNTLTFDSTPTASSSNPVTSDGIKDAIDDTATDIFEVMGKNGAKNLLPIEVSTQTISSVTYTINSDGTMDIQGQNTSSSWISLNVCSFTTLKSILSKYKGKQMIFSITSDYDYDTRNVCLYYNIGGTATYVVPNPKEKTFTIPNNIDQATAITVPVGVNTGKTASTTNLGIMLRLANDADSNYAPYAMTNRELTEHHTTVAKTFTQSSTDVATYLRNANTSSYIAFGYSYNRTMITANAIFTIKASGNALYKSDGTTATSGNENWELIKIPNFPYSKAIPDGPLSGLLFLNRTDLKDLYCSKRGNDLIFAISATDYADFVGKGVRLSATIMLK